MGSELWQRLREVRKFADKRQVDMARIAGVTRSGYAFWETPDAASRTRPNSDQIVAICKETRVPVGWLLDDRSETGELWLPGGPPVREGAVLAASVSSTEPALPQVTDSDRAQQRFWAAVEYEVTNADPTRENSFGQILNAGAISVTADYQHGDVMALFTKETETDALLSVAGRLLLCARLAKLKTVAPLVLIRSAHAVDETVRESFRRFLGVTLVPVTSPEEAATQLLSQ